MANQRAQGLGLVDIPDLNVYLNGLLQRIKAKTQLPETPGNVYITAASDSMAQATPDGNIYVSLGMLNVIEAEDEIVALLAHEFAHVALGHHNSDVWGNYQKQIQMGFSLGAQIMSNLEAGTDNALLSRGQTKGLDKIQLAIETTDRVLHPAWKRSQEEDADRLAIDISVRMGYSFARGYKTMLERMTTLQEGIEAERQKDFQQRLATQFKDNNFFNTNGQSSPFNPTNIEKILGSAAKELKDLVFNKLSANHADGAKRIATGVAYHEQFYDDLPRPEPKIAAWQAILKRPSVKGVMDNYRLADESAAALLKKDIRSAVALAQKATAKPTENHPYTLLALAKAFEATGDSGSQIKTLQRLEKLPTPVWQFYEMRAQQELYAGRRDKAEQFMEEGYQRFGGAAVLRPRLIGFDEKIGNKDKVNLLVLDCGFKTPGQRDECMKAGGTVKIHGRKSSERK